MFRFAKLAVIGILALTVVGIAPSVAAAQTGDVAAFCAASIESNTVESKAEIPAVLDKAVAVAPAAISQTAREFRDLFAKKGTRGAESPQGIALVNQIDAYNYDNCPGTQVPVTAADYEFQGVPATMRAGLTRLKITNTSTKDDHEMVLVKLTPAGTTVDPVKLLALPDKKAAKYVDFSTAEFTYAPAGEIGYAYIDLVPGTYLYMCPLPVDGTKHAKAHWMEGMYGTTSVA